MCKRLICISLIVWLGLKCVAQEFRPCPSFNKTIRWQPEVYKAQNDTAKAVLNWLCQTPFSDQSVLRADASLYVMQWISGHPEYRFEINDANCFQAYFFTEELNLAYIFGNVQQQLRSGDFHSQSVAGLKVVGELSSYSKVYSKNKFIHELQRAVKKKKVSEFYKKYCNYKL